jgi:hypothetical protein
MSFVIAPRQVEAMMRTRFTPAGGVGASRSVTPSM